MRQQREGAIRQVPRSMKESLAALFCRPREGIWGSRPGGVFFPGCFFVMRGISLTGRSYDPWSEHQSPEVRPWLRKGRDENEDRRRQGCRRDLARAGGRGPAQ